MNLSGSVCPVFGHGLPVEPAPTDAAPPRISLALVTWFLGLLVLAILALRVNFFPATEVVMWGLGVAVFASIVMTRWTWGNDARADEHVHLYVSGFPLWVFLHYLLFGSAGR